MLVGPMAKKIIIGKRIALDTSHILSLIWPDLNRTRQNYLNRIRRYFYRIKMRRLGIFKGAIVHVSDVACREAYDKAGVTREDIRAMHEGLGATVYFGDMTREMHADADEMVGRHEELHISDAKILAHAKYWRCVLCTRDAVLGAVARAEGACSVNPDATTGSPGHLYEWPKTDRHDAQQGGTETKCPVPPAPKRRGRLLRRGCPHPSDPRFRDMDGRPARGNAAWSPSS